MTSEANPADPAAATTVPGDNANQSERMRAFSVFVWKNRFVWFFVLVALSAGIDQATKIWAQGTLATEKDVTPVQLDEGTIENNRLVLEKTPLAPERIQLGVDENAPLAGQCNRARIPYADDSTPDGFAFDVATNTLTLKGACAASASIDASARYKYASRAFVPTNTITVVPNAFNFMYAENPAAAFSLTSSLPTWLRRPFLLFVSSIATIFITVFFFYLRRPDGLLMTAFALIVGGALGNFIDRARFGYVVDFLDAYAGFIDPAWRHWPTFNIADACIVVGALSVVWRTMKPIYPDDTPVADEA